MITTFAAKNVQQSLRLCGNHFLAIKMITAINENQPMWKLLSNQSHHDRSTFLVAIVAIIWKPGLTLCASDTFYSLVFLPLIAGTLRLSTVLTFAYLIRQYSTSKINVKMDIIICVLTFFSIVNALRFYCKWFESSIKCDYWVKWELSLISSRHAHLHVYPTLAIKNVENLHVKFILCVLLL